MGLKRKKKQNKKKTKPSKHKILTLFELNLNLPSILRLCILAVLRPCNNTRVQYVFKC